MLCDRIGEITFDSIDFVGHGQAGGLAMGRYNSRISNRIWLHPAVLAAFTDLRVRLRDERSVIRLLGCNVARPIGREHRLVGTDGELLCMALARMADHTVEACAAGVRAGDFTADGVRASLELARFDRDGQLLARSLG